MNKQNIQRWQSSLPITLTIIFLLGSFNATFAQKGIGKKYNSRDPQPCGKRASRGKAPTAAEAAASVICNGEHEVGNESLYLYEDVKVTQIGGGTPYKPGVDFNVDDIDLHFLLYPIRGSLKIYNCGVPGVRPAGRNCWLSEHKNAQGRCYKNTFGEWQCSMIDNSVGIGDYTEVAPPGGANAAAAADVQNKPTAEKNDKQNAATKTDPDENKGAGNFPKPDFSAMEEFYEIVKYEYAPLEKKIYIIVKSKTAVHPYDFYLELRDKDGLLLQDHSVSFILGLPGSTDPVGEPKKVYASLPYLEKDMTRIVNAKAVRAVN